MVGPLALSGAAEQAEERLDEFGREPVHGGELFARRKTQRIIGREALGDLSSPLSVRAGNRNEPFEVALVHYIERLDVLLKGRCIVAITPSSQCVNMTSLGRSHPRGRIRVEGDLEQDTSGARAETN